MKLFILNLLIFLGLCPSPEPPEVNMEVLCEVEIVESPKPIKTLEMVATAYCGCSYCCGKSDCITASGTRATEGRTIAADISVFPFGTHLRINGVDYIVEDCGGGIHGNRLDIYFESHEDALRFGVQTVTVEVFEEKLR